jgi:hypothetical protein
MVVGPRRPYQPILAGRPTDSSSGERVEWNCGVICIIQASDEIWAVGGHHPGNCCSASRRILLWALRVADLFDSPGPRLGKYPAWRRQTCATHMWGSVCRFEYRHALRCFLDSSSPAYHLFSSGGDFVQRRGTTERRSGIMPDFFLCKIIGVLRNNMRELGSG